MVGIKERGSRQIRSFRVADTKAITLHQIVCDSVSEGSMVYTNDATTYEGLQQHDCRHETARHSVGEYVRGQVHTGGTESFWSCLKRGYYGVYHKMSPKYLQKYVDEFSARQNVRELDTIVPVDIPNGGLFGKRLKYADLIDGMDGRID